MSNFLFTPDYENGLLSGSSSKEFRSLLWTYYAQFGRSFAWRNVEDPYKIVVSEIMLQQTQTFRVEEKYQRFIEELPSFDALSQASVKDVLGLWQGLGYNRRGLALQKIAQKVMNEYEGMLPKDPEILVEFPGIGPATASSICAFAFNQPTIFIETNVRAVFIFHFFKNEMGISDKQLLPFVAQTVDLSNPREWYYALMDYGVMLKKKFKNPARASKHHTRQSKFEGSDRQIRGAIIRLLLDHGRLQYEALFSLLSDMYGSDISRIQRIVLEMEKEKFVRSFDDSCALVE